MQYSENYMYIWITIIGFKSTIPAQNFWINPYVNQKFKIDGDIIMALFFSINVGKGF